MSKGRATPQIEPAVAMGETGRTPEKTPVIPVDHVLLTIKREIFSPNNRPSSVRGAKGSNMLNKKVAVKRLRPKHGEHKDVKPNKTGIHEILAIVT